MKILLTAFVPFGGETVNAAQAAAALVREEIDGVRIIKADVPVAFRRAVDTVLAVMERERPDAVLCIGQAGGRAALTPERVAINVDDARMPDNEGFQPVDQPIFPDGAAAYFSTLPIKTMTAAIQKAGLPAEVSNSAGTYVCNHLMYGVLYHINRSYPQMRGGFMHVPFLCEQAADHPGTTGMARGDMAAGIEAALRAIAESLRASGG